MLCCVPLHSIEKILIKTILLVKQIRIYKTRFIFYIIYTKRNTKYHRLDQDLKHCERSALNFILSNGQSQSKFKLAVK